MIKNIIVLGVMFMVVFFCVKGILKMVKPSFIYGNAQSTVSVGPEMSSSGARHTIFVDKIGENGDVH